MAEIDFERSCPACGRTNEGNAKRCAVCGADLQVEAEAAGTDFVDDYAALKYVDPNNRVELDRFERADQAELACGLLRSNGIPCELSTMVLPGLPADMILWVHTKDARLAWALLADAEREASKSHDKTA